ncbi:hypothetical protein CPB86DRAFT_787283 [Serendipita vermifera]|nr:hypothetical protein CPB86DRAFT_787283 [Serendipita vermifera]
MATLKSLPLELVLDIVHLALLSCDANDLPTVGLDAAWNIPRIIEFNRKLGLSSSVQSSQTPPKRPESVSSFVDLSAKSKPLTSYELAKIFRLVNRTFNNLAAPVVYNHVNLLGGLNSLDKLSGITHNMIIPYAHHIHALHIFVDSANSQQNPDCEKYAAGIISACRQLASLALYYHNGHRDWPLLSQEVLYSIERGHLAHLGIYSTDVFIDLLDDQEQPAVEALLKRLAGSSVARASLKTLDLSVESISMESYTVVRSKFPSLEHVTFRNALRATLGRPSAASQRQHWMHWKNLKRLQLRRCESGYSADIPFLVQNFPALRELLVSTCGVPTDPVVVRNPAGWYLLPDALYKTHAPLDLFHIEHMDDWEMRAMGIIPTTTLMVTSIQSMHLLGILKEDKDLFPGLKILRLGPYPGQRTDLLNNSKWRELVDICSARNVGIRRDAVTIYPCICSGDEGF